MKKFILILSLINFTKFASAQCTGCTTTISGLNTTNQIISAGQTLCISSTGTVTGLITVSAGGSVCNEGSITSSNFWVAGGSLRNYGNINVSNLLVSAAGTFTNYSVTDADSLLITDASSNYINNGTQINKAFAVAINANAINNGTVNSILMYDSIGVYVNNGTINLSGSLGTDYTSNFTNNGNLNIALDLGNGHNSIFTNNKFITIQRDFLNGSSANFITNCIINVGRNWYNDATITGAPLSSCGGFSITGLSGNTGTIGSAISHVDMCDVGHPTFGLDGPGGTIASTTTYCTCMNTCIEIVGIKEIKNTLNSIFYPNPANDKLNIEVNSQSIEVIEISITNLFGELVFKTLTSQNEKSQINLSDFKNGLYFITVKQNNNSTTQKIIIQH